jgi:hypothetical protein
MPGMGERGRRAHSAKALSMNRKYKGRGQMGIGKKLVIAGVILGLLMGTITGCETLKSAFCSPTAQEVVDAADCLAHADAVLNFMSTLVPSAEVAAAIAAIKIAKTVFAQIQSGICVSPEQETAAKTAVQASQTMAIKRGYQP